MACPMSFPFAEKFTKPACSMIKFEKIQGESKKTAIIKKGEIKDRHSTMICSKSNLCKRLF